MVERRVASMFAGIGGICLGFKQAGFDIVWANEINAAACRTYRHNFGNSYLIESDIHKINTETMPDFDVLTAGFPCQSFSIGGKQRGFEDNRGILFFEVIRIIAAKKPIIVFLENVENLVQHDNGKTFLVIYNTLAALGYIVRYQVMPTNEYGGLPQSRRRIYIIAFLDYKRCDSFQFPAPIPLEMRIVDIVKRNEPQNDVYYYTENTDIWHRIRACIGNSQNLFRVYKGHVRNLRTQGLCPTLTASMCDEYNAVVLRDVKGIRRLTLREMLDFQGFGGNFYFPKTVTLADACRQIGNSVSVTVIKRIASVLK